MTRLLSNGQVELKPLGEQVNRISPDKKEECVCGHWRIEHGQRFCEGDTGYDSDCSADIGCDCFEFEGRKRAMIQGVLEL